jgi:outer membrane biosynthesis protein TonB
MRIKLLTNTIASLNEALVEEIDKNIITGGYADLIENTPSDIAARYWLMQLLEPLNKKELKSVVDGFLVQNLNEDQASKLIKFLLLRFPQYYAEDTTKPLDVSSEGQPALVLQEDSKPKPEPEPKPEPKPEPAPEPEPEPKPEPEPQAEPKPEPKPEPIEEVAI